jgi:hypothetical protein
VRIPIYGVFDGFFFLIFIIPIHIYLFFVLFAAVCNSTLGRRAQSLSRRGVVT